MSDPLDPHYLIGAISNGLPGGMPAWKQEGLSDQDIRDIAAFIIRENRFHQAAGLFATGAGPERRLLGDRRGRDHGRAAHLLAHYNVRWIARRSAARRQGEGPLTRARAMIDK